MDLILTTLVNRKTNKAKQKKITIHLPAFSYITQAHHAHKTMDQCVKLQKSAATMFYMEFCVACDVIFEKVCWGFFCRRRFFLRGFVNLHCDLDLNFFYWPFEVSK